MKQFVSIECYDHKQTKSVQRIIDTLNQEALRLSGHFEAQRGHGRKEFNGVVTIRVPNPDFANHGIGEPSFEFKAYCRDVSAGGTSFIYPEEIDVRKIFIGLGNGSKKTWFNGEIVRSREMIEEDFWEYGVAFRGRLEL